MEIISRHNHRLSTLLLAWTVCVFSSLAAAVEESPDSVKRLAEVEVRGHGRRSARVTPDGSVTIDLSMLGASPRLFGEADLLRSLSATAGVTTISDYSSGASIDGMDYSQNMYLLNGAPVQFPYHFGGIFSTFNAMHYPTVTMSKSIHPSGAPDCLGGVVATSTADSSPVAPEGCVNVGMLASSFALKYPLFGRLTLSAAARVSYIDMLYHDLIRTDDTDVSYNLHDLDFEARYNFTPDGKCLKLFVHHNGDRLSYDDDNFVMSTRLNWHNTVAGAQYTSEALDATLSMSAMSNRLGMSMPQFYVDVPSSVTQWSGTATYRFKSTGLFDISAGAAANHYSAEPQSLESKGFGNDRLTEGRTFKSGLAKLWASAVCHATSLLSITVGLDANSYFGPDNFTTIALDPRMTARLRAGNADLTIHVGRYYQYLHQVGFSEIGMPSNFKMVATRNIRPQQSVNFVIGAATPLPMLHLRVNADLFFKRVLAQPEYFGGILDLLDSGYTPDAYVSGTSGYTTGMNITVARNFEALTASATYSYNLGKRRLPGTDSYFTASSDIRHSVNLSVAYEFPGNHWSVTAAWAYASGRPVTPVKAAYFIGERLMVQYGPRNSSRLPAYHRLDLGASYRFTTGRLNQHLNLSVVNAYGHRNVEISTYRFNTDTGALRIREISSLFRFLPSLSYTIEF